MIGLPSVATASQDAPASTPAPPWGLVAVQDDEGVVHLAWNAPVYDGGSPVDHYLVERSENGGPFSSLDIATGTSYEDETVSGGNTYTYRVKAVNQHGESPPSNVAIAVHGTVIPDCVEVRPEPPFIHVNPENCTPATKTDTGPPV